MLNRVVKEREREGDHLNGSPTAHAFTHVLRRSHAISGTAVEHQHGRRGAEKDVLTGTLDGATGSESHGREGEDGDQSFASVHAGYLGGTVDTADKELPASNREGQSKGLSRQEMQAYAPPLGKPPDAKSRHRCQLRPWATPDRDSITRPHQGE